MKFFVTIVALLLTALTLVRSISKHEADFASVINKLETIDFKTIDDDALTSLSIDILMFIAYFDGACIKEKLGLNNVPQSAIYDIPNLKEFHAASNINWKIIAVLENAGKICSKNFKHHPYIGILQNIELRDNAIQSIFPEAKSNPTKASECFKWALSQSKPTSPLLDGFDVKAMTHSVDECKATTSLENISNMTKHKITKHNIKSCDFEKYGQPKIIAESVMEKFLKWEILGTPNYNKIDEETTAAAVAVEVKILETQIKCLLDDLENEE